MIQGKAHTVRRSLRKRKGYFFLCGCFARRRRRVLRRAKARRKHRAHKQRGDEKTRNGSVDPHISKPSFAAVRTAEIHLPYCIRH